MSDHYSAQFHCQCAGNYQYVKKYINLCSGFSDSVKNSGFFTLICV